MKSAASARRDGLQQQAQATAERRPWPDTGAELHADDGEYRQAKRDRVEHGDPLGIEHDQIVGGEAADAGDDRKSRCRRGGVPAVLPGRLRLTDEGDRNQDEGERVERTGEPFMQLGPELARLAFEIGIVGGGVGEFVEVALARLQLGLDPLLLEPVDVDDVALELDDLRRVQGARPAHDMAVVHQQERLLVLLYQHAMLGEIGGRHLGIAVVVHQQAAELAVQGALPDVERQARARGSRSARAG